MFLRTKKARNIFKATGLFFLITSCLCFAFSLKAQTEEQTVTDAMGNKYKLEMANGTLYFNTESYDGRPIDSGSIGAIKNSEYIVSTGDNCIYIVYVDNANRLTARILASTFKKGTWDNRIMTLETNIDSLAKGRVSILESHRFGAYVGWTNSKGEEKYAVFDLWNGKTEEGPLKDLRERRGYPKRGDIGYNGEGDVTGRISGDSVVIVLDSSGSMSGEKIKHAKNKIRKYVNRLDKDDEVALFIFEGCGNVPLIQGFTQNHSAIIQGLSRATASGGSSPIAESIRVGLYYLNSYHHGEKGKLVLYSDGGENCSGNPVAAASEVKESKLSIDFTFVGYNLRSDAKKDIKEIVDAADGNFDKETVLDPKDAQFNAVTQQQKAATTGAASLMSALTSFAMSGGIDPRKMIYDLFGPDGLFRSFGMTQPPIDPSQQAVFDLPSGAVDSALTGVSSALQADLRYLSRMRNDLANYRQRLKDALEANDVAAARKWTKNIERLGQQIRTTQNNLERGGYQGKWDPIKTAIGTDLQTDQQLWQAAHNALDNYARNSDAVNQNREIFIDNVGRAMIKFIDGFRDPTNPYLIIPHKDVNPFLGARDDAKILGDQIKNIKHQIKTRDHYYQEFLDNIEEYKNREGARQAAEQANKILSDLDNKINP